MSLLSGISVNQKAKIRFHCTRVGISLALLFMIMPLTATPAAAITGPITSYIVWDADQTIATDVVVGNGGVLTIESCTTTFADSDATPSAFGLSDKVEIIVVAGGTLIINPGAKLTAVLAGDWGGLVFLSDSVGTIRSATIENATQGVLIVSATVDIRESYIENILAESGDNQIINGHDATGIQAVGTSKVTLYDNRIYDIYAGAGYPGRDGQIQVAPGNDGTKGGSGGHAIGISVITTGETNVVGNYVSSVHGGAGGVGGNGASGLASNLDGADGGNGGIGGEGGDALGLFVIGDVGSTRGNRVGDAIAGSGGAGGAGYTGTAGAHGTVTTIDGGSGGGGGQGGHGGNGGESIGMMLLGPTTIERNRIVGMVQGGSGGTGGNGANGGQGADGYESSTSGASGGHGGNGGSASFGGDGGNGGLAIGFDFSGAGDVVYQFNSVESVIQGGNGASAGDGGNGGVAGNGADGTTNSGGLGGAGGDGGIGGHGGNAGSCGVGGEAYGVVLDEVMAVEQSSTSEADLNNVPILSASYISEIQGGYAGSPSTAGEGANGGAGGWGGSGQTSGIAGLGGPGGNGGNGSVGGSAGDAAAILNNSSSRFQNNMVFIVNTKASSNGGNGGNAGDGGWDGGSFGFQALGGDGGDGGNGGAGAKAAGIRSSGDAIIVHNSGASVTTSIAAAQGGLAGAGGDFSGAPGSVGAEGSPPEAYGVILESGEPTVQFNIIAPPAVGAASATPVYYGLYKEPAVTQMTADRNLVQGWTQNYGPGVAPGPNDISLEPRYRDAAAGDLHLAGNSPAIDAGLQTGSLDYLPLNDSDDESRPNGVAYDIGADEYSQCVAVVSTDFSGPKIGTIGAVITIDVAPVPDNATQPVYFQWSPEPLTGQGTNQATYRPLTVGHFYPSIEYASNCGGKTGGHDFTVSIVEPLLLPAMLVNQ